MANNQNLIPFKKGQSGNPKGRPKSYVTSLRDRGYKNHEILDTIKVMLSLSMEELKKLHDNPESTILEKGIAAALVKDYKRGVLYSAEMLLNRAFGKARESIELDAHISLGEVNSTLTI